MTREMVAQYIHWPWIIWIVGIVNPFFMVPQLWKIWRRDRADDVSLPMLTILTGIQAGFSAHGFFLHDNPLFLSNLAATAVTVATAFSTLYIRRNREWGI